MSTKPDYSKKILKILGEKTAISLPDLTNQVNSKDCSQSSVYAITRSLKGLREAGLIENISSGQNDYARLTKEGKKKINSLKLDSDTTLVDTSWDGFWRIILLDLPETRKSERESLRYLLKKAGFVCLKNSAWISPYPYEHLFENIKKDLELTTEMMIIKTQFIDEETKKFLFDTFKK
ncbi:MAG: hypothetical protein WAV23_01520 [Minisyncoccia bacterium]